MKLRVVSSKKEIDELNKNEQLIHLAFRAANTDIFKLLQNCPRVRAVQIPSSYRRTLSRASEMFLVMQGVELIEGDVWGHRKDIDEYYCIDERILRRIEVLRDGGANINDIARTVSCDSKLSPALVKYLLKQIS